MISNNIIRSEIPDNSLEPELYEYVTRFQIHTCGQKCGGPALPGDKCKKGFPRPFSNRTFLELDSLRYTYRCTKEGDQWVVPYHAPTLLIWKAHINAQYVSSKSLARYINKYILKSEPSHLFNIQEGNLYREHVHARRMGSMELMFLLLGETICDSSKQVKYLVTDPPNVRSKCILPISMINLNDDEPYWKDQIEKYFSRPRGNPFDSISYKEYFKKYEIKMSAITSTNRHVFRDLLDNYVVERKSPILVRYR